MEAWFGFEISCFHYEFLSQKHLPFKMETYLHIIIGIIHQLQEVTSLHKGDVLWIHKRICLIGNRFHVTLRIVRILKSYSNIIFCLI